MKKLITAVLAAILCMAMLAGCQGMSDEMLAAVNGFTEQTSRITSQVEQAGELVTQAQEVLSNGKPVSDVKVTSQLQSVIEEVKEKVKFEMPERPASLNAINEKIQELTLIDYTPYLNKLQEAIQNVTNSQEDYAMNDTLVTKGADGWGVYENDKLTDYSGIAKNQYGTWYVKDGKVDFTFSGDYEFAGQTFKVDGGKVQ